MDEPVQHVAGGRELFDRPRDTGAFLGERIEPSITVAILGLGPMGRALAAASLAAGHSTVVWNRVPR